MKKFLNWIKKLKLKKQKIYIRKNVKFSNTIFEGNNKVGENSEIINSYLGVGSYIGKFCVLNETKIGKFCSIGFHVKLYAGNHPFQTITTHPAFYTNSHEKMGLFFQNIPELTKIKKTKNNYNLEIGNDVWIGSEVIIVTGGGNITIGDGAVIGAGAVVTKDIEPYTINVGVPARAIKKRFSDEDIKTLLEFQWWNKDLDWIKNNSHYFFSPEKFRKIATFNKKV